MRRALEQLQQLTASLPSAHIEQARRAAEALPQGQAEQRSEECALAL
jgi:hypothetical protein